MNMIKRGCFTLCQKCGNITETASANLCKGLGNRTLIHYTAFCSIPVKYRYRYYIIIVMYFKSSQRYSEASETIIPRRATGRYQ